MQVDYQKQGGGVDPHCWRYRVLAEVPSREGRAQSGRELSSLIGAM